MDLHTRIAFWCNTCMIFVYMDIPLTQKAARDINRVARCNSWVHMGFFSKPVHQAPTSIARSKDNGSRQPHQHGLHICVNSHEATTSRVSYAVACRRASSTRWCNSEIRSRLFSMQMCSSILDCQINGHTSNEHISKRNKQVSISPINTYPYSFKFLSSCAVLQPACLFYGPELSVLSPNWQFVMHITYLVMWCNIICAFPFKQGNV